MDYYTVFSSRPSRWQRIPAESRLFARSLANVLGASGYMLRAPNEDDQEGTLAYHMLWGSRLFSNRIYGKQSTIPGIKLSQEKPGIEDQRLVSESLKILRWNPGRVSKGLQFRYAQLALCLRGRPGEGKSRMIFTWTESGEKKINRLQYREGDSAIAMAMAQILGIRSVNLGNAEDLAFSKDWENRNIWKVYELIDEGLLSGSLLSRSAIG